MVGDVPLNTPAWGPGLSTLSHNIIPVSGFIAPAAARLQGSATCFCTQQTPVLRVKAIGMADLRSRSAAVPGSARNAVRLDAVKGGKQDDTFGADDAREEHRGPLRTRGGVLPSGAVLAVLFATGFVLGPVLDGIHSAVDLLIYENGAITLGSLHTNVAVPLLLGVYYVLAGALTIYLDRILLPQGLSNESVTRKSPTDAALCLFTTASLLALSSYMYSHGYLPVPMLLLLLLLGVVHWALFDRTLQGFKLSLAAAILAPPAETLLMHFFHVWYYPKGDWVLWGSDPVYTAFPSFVPACYFLYTTYIATLARALNTWSSRREDRGE